MTRLSRRFLMRGMIGGAAVTLGLPLLDCFLDGNGQALASGAPIPTRFGTWFWGCGNTPARYTPKTFGAGWEMTPELQPLASHRSKLNVFSNFDVFLDGAPNDPHVSGLWTLRTGTAPSRGIAADVPSFDVLISEAIGGRSRFKSLDVSCSGQTMHSYSRRSASVVNPADPSPTAFYQRVFGTGFRDPNSTGFEPDPALMTRQSVLSAVKDQRTRLMAMAGRADRDKLDQFFTAVRQVEQQVAMQSQKPPPAESCVVAKAPDPRIGGGTNVEDAVASHALMAEIMALALACNQTRAFNVVFNESTSSLHKPGEAFTHHSYTHSEPIDPKLGYQPNVSSFTIAALQAFSTFLTRLDSIKEGDRTLLDNSLVFGHADTSYARAHSLENIPVLMAGAAGGQLKTGLHINGQHTPISRTVLTALQAMGVGVERFGTKTMETTKVVGDVIAA